MGRTLIKVEKDVDRYVLWSSFVDAPLGVGTAKEWEKYYIKQAKEQAKDDFKAMLTKADEHGSSAGGVRQGYGQWDDDNWRYQGTYTYQDKEYLAYVSRQNFKSFIEKLIELDWDYESEELAPLLELEDLDD